MSVEINTQLQGAKILEIILRDGDDTSIYQGEYCNYELLVITDKGVLKFAGCHDSGGEIEIETSEEMISRYYHPAARPGWMGNINPVGADPDVP